MRRLFPQTRSALDRIVICETDGRADIDAACFRHVEAMSVLRTQQPPPQTLLDIDDRGHASSHPIQMARARGMNPCNLLPPEKFSAAPDVDVFEMMEFSVGLWTLHADSSPPWPLKRHEIRRSPRD